MAMHASPMNSLEGVPNICAPRIFLSGVTRIEQSPVIPSFSATKRPDYVMGNLCTVYSIPAFCACSSVIPVPQTSGFVYTTPGIAL